ncbi:acetyl-CoA carboxylase, carboxyltransferase subunit beta [Tumidithrix elongata RA019]|uniref:Acetyl-coenzyme A carboxylase carboxyl transferase subunit beta n=1 Tax=Tumidithrix elongata BACA0141 TaxID=2716417 RepID=A0AAW9PYA8_9CYAN|nr:acetyl-CoA carboxylase, carboxyltransferase subunit beta [Tumidithrix elongata RA019]
MSLFDWFAETRSRANEVHRREVQNVTPPQYQEREIPDGLWHKCSSCSVLTYIKDLRTNLMVCPECGHHNQVSASDRIAQLVDVGSWGEIDAQLSSCDPLEFRDRKPYSDRLKEYKQKTGLEEGVVTGIGSIEGNPTALAIMDFRFMGGSMGSAVGEKITRLIEAATQKRIPVILFCASGGARMQEGILSLMQMAKTSAALERHRRDNLLYIPVLTNPTTGGVTASFAMLGDIILAEPKAMIGFTGRRVIEQTLKQKIPDDFQSAEYLLGHGFVDSVIPRTRLKSTLAMILRLHNITGTLQQSSASTPVSSSKVSSSDTKLNHHSSANTKPENENVPIPNRP